MQDQLPTGDSNASAALLMLDISSAKTTLARLQQACAAATDEHSRTKTELFSLQQQHIQSHGASYVLDGLRTPLGSQTTAQQLQALHTENLQLKACLKQEVEARQQLENKHAELLDLLRGGRVLELLAASFVPSGTPSTQAMPGQQQQQWPSTEEVYRMISSTDSTQPSIHTAEAAKASQPSSSTLAGKQQPGRTASSSSSYTSSGDCTTPVAPAQPSRLQHSSDGGSTNSAYFPAAHATSHPAVQQDSQQQQPAARLWRQPQHCGPSREAATGRAASGAAAGAAAGSAAAMAAAQPLAAPGSPSAGVPATWQDSMQQGLFAKLAQHGSSTQGHVLGGQAGSAEHHAGSTPGRSMQQHRAESDGAHSVQQHWQQQRQQQHEPLLHTVAFSTATGYEVQEGLLSASSSSSSRSGHSELLDSEDLDELAGLCDSLLQRHSSLPVDGTAPGLGDGQQQEQQEWWQQELAGTAWFVGTGLEAVQECQHRVPSQQALAPGLQALADQLRQLQEQVSATVMDAVAAARGSSSSTGGSLGGRFASSSPSGRQQGHAGPGEAAPAGAAHPSTGHAARDQISSQQGCAASGPGPTQQAGSEGPGPLRGSAASWGGSGAALGRPQQAQPGQQQGHLSEAAEGPAMASLQQQLAQRMQEVKDRLSKICNGMLQEDHPAPAHADHGGASSGGGGIKPSSSFCSPPVSPPAQHGSAAAEAWQEPGSAGRPPAGHAAAATAAAGRYMGGGSTASTPPVPSAAGKLAGSGWRRLADPPGQHQADAPKARRVPAAAKAPAQAPPQRSARARPAPAADAGAAAAAAFASIKAAIDSTPDLHEVFDDACFAAAEGCCQAGGAPAAVPGAQVGGGSAAAAVGQGSWASAEDVAATDSEGSWATVDESEQEGLAQQQQGQRQEVFGGQQGMNESYRQRTASNDGERRMGGRTCSSRQSSAEMYQQQQQEEVAGGEAYEPGFGVAGGGAERDHYAGRPASPVSCESSMLAAAARLPADVAFSPVKAGAGRQG